MPCVLFFFIQNIRQTFFNTKQNKVKDNLNLVIMKYVLKELITSPNSIFLILISWQPDVDLIDLMMT